MIEITATHIGACRKPCGRRMLNLRATNWNTRLRKLLAEHSAGRFKDFFFYSIKQVDKRYK